SEDRRAVPAVADAAGDAVPFAAGGTRPDTPPTEPVCLIRRGSRKSRPRSLMLPQIAAVSSDGRVGDATETTIPELQLSAPQLGIWIDWLIDPAGTNYDMSEYLEIFGTVDVVTFERALRAVVKEAEALNVRIVERPDGPRQIREDLTDWPMPVVDFS